MRRLTVLVVPFLIVPALSAPAEAAKPSCASAGEYSRIKNGMTQSRVIDIVGGKGRLLFANPGIRHNSAREWHMCGSSRRMQVQMNNYRLGGPQRVVYKQRY